MKTVYLLLLVMLFLSSCRKDEFLLNGEISGIISVFDQYFILNPDLSGTKVSLYRDTALLGIAFTDAQGIYNFEKMPYGRYHISYQKENYIQTRDPHTIYHIGGSRPTLYNYSLYEIPTYTLSIDSVDCSSGFLDMIIYLKFNGDTLIPATGHFWNYTFIGFASNSPELNKSQYVARVKGVMQDLSMTYPNPKIAALGRVYLYEWDMEQLIADTIYLTICPLAAGQGYWINEYDPEALGPQSNTYGFLYDE